MLEVHFGDMAELVDATDLTTLSLFLTLSIAEKKVKLLNSEKLRLGLLM